MNDLETYRRQADSVQDAVRTFYDLHWPGKPYRADLRVLVAGCGTSQAAKHALRSLRATSSAST